MSNIVTSITKRIQGKRPALLWSGGLDSTLILAMLREQEYVCDIVQQGREWWTKEQKKWVDKLIHKWNLKVFSYPPIQSYLIGQDSDISIVSEYAVGRGRIPIITDVVQGDNCLADIAGQHLYQSPILWDMFLVGSRKDDTHWAKETVVPNETWQIADVEFYAPLYNYTRQDVIDGLKERGLDATEVPDELNTGNYLGCTNCLKGTEDVWCPKDSRMIPVIQWNAGENLKLFQQTYA